MENGKSRLLIAVSLIPLLLPSPLAAQETITPAAQDTGASEEQGDIIVRGIRDALESSANKKREAGNIKDVVTAEDIGKFPDENVTESLSRVTGVQITRDVGEGSNFTIRGISQNRVEINGRTAVGRGEGRNPNISDIPADLLGSLEVIKSPTADLVEGSLGGTVNLQTRRPFDFKSPTLNINLRQGYSTKSEEFQPQLNLLATDRWDLGGGEFGALFNISYSESKLKEEEARPDFWVQACNFDLDGDGVRSAAAPVDDNGDRRLDRCVTDPDDLVFRPASLTVLNTERRRRRMGIVGSLQWKPSTALTVYFDGNYDTYRDEDVRYNLSSGGVNQTAGFGTAAAPNIVAITKDAHGSASSITFGARRPTSQSQVGVDDASSFSGALGGRWTPSARWAIEAEVGGSSGTNNGTQTQVNGEAVGANGLVTLNIVRDGKAFTIDYQDMITGPNNFQTIGFNDVRFTNDRDERFARVDFDWTFDSGLLRSIEFGARGTTDRFERDRERSRDNTLKTLFSSSPDLASRTLTYDNRNFLAGLEGASFPAGYFVVNSQNILQDIQFYRNFFRARPFERQPDEEYRLEEKTAAGYLKFNVEGSLGAIPFRGNAGVRVVTTSLASFTEILTGANTFVPTVTERSYTNALPSANITFELGPDLLLRGAFAKTMVRPSFAQLRPALAVNLATSAAGCSLDDPCDGSQGNPNLDPFDATQYDLSLEKYWGKGGLASVSVFYRDVAAFIRSNERQITLPDGRVVDLTFPVNGDQATIKGVETSLQMTFDFLPGFLNGFGVVANYTFSDSKQTGENSTDRFGEALQLENLSKHAYNAAAFFEKYNIYARLSYNWRSRRLITSFSNFDGRAVYVAPESQMDFSAGWDVNPKFRISFDVRNLLGRFNREYIEREAWVRRISTEDKKFTVGVRAKF